MRGERYQNLIATLLIVLAVATLPLVVNLSGLWWLWAPLLASLATLAAVFLREVDLPVGGRSPAEVREALAAVLGASAMVRAPHEDSVTARLNALAAVRFRTRVADQGTVLSYQVWMTRAGWALLAALVLSGVGSLVASMTGLALLRRGSKFVKSVGNSLAQKLQAVSPEPTRDEVHGLLVGGLSTTLRMAREAYEAQRKAYTDSLLTTAIAAFTAWTALLVGLFVALNGFNLLTGRWEVPIAAATGMALVFGILFLVSLRRRYVPRLARYREWTERLADSMGVQLARAPPESGRPNTFELLVSASEQVPDWLDAQRRAGLSGDPKTAFVILLLTLFTGSFLMNGFAQLLFGGISSVGIAYLAIAAFLVGLAAWIYLRWKREEEARLNQSRAAWEAHLKALHARMDRFLEEM